MPRPRGIHTYLLWLLCSTGHRVCRQTCRPTSKQAHTQVPQELQQGKHTPSSTPPDQTQQHNMSSSHDTRRHPLLTLTLNKHAPLSGVKLGLRPGTVGLPHIQPGAVVPLKAWAVIIARVVTRNAVNNKAQAAILTTAVSSYFSPTPGCLMLDLSTCQMSGMHVAGGGESLQDATQVDLCLMCTTGRGMRLYIP
jgi:hypothetical protein